MTCIGSTQTSAQTGAGKIVLDLRVPKGYGWVFPKNKKRPSASVFFKGKGKKPRGGSTEFLRRNGLKCGLAAASRSAFISTLPKGPHSLVRGSILFAGHVAALVKALFGEGIYCGIRSGQIAARTTCDTVLERAKIAHDQ